MESRRKLNGADLLCADRDGGESCWWSVDGAIALASSSLIISPPLTCSRLDILSCNLSVIVDGDAAASVRL